MRVPIFQREIVSAIIMRRKRQSINNISKALGRSTHMIARWLKKACENGVLRKFDLRKLPHALRMRMASKNRVIMGILLPAYTRFNTGEEEEPP